MYQYLGIGETDRRSGWESVLKAYQREQLNEGKIGWVYPLYQDNSESQETKSCLDYQWRSFHKGMSLYCTQA